MNDHTRHFDMFDKDFKSLRQTFHAEDYIKMRRPPSPFRKGKLSLDREGNQHGLVEPGRIVGILDSHVRERQSRIDLCGFEQPFAIRNAFPLFAVDEAHEIQLPTTYSMSFSVHRSASRQASEIIGLSARNVCFG